MSLPLEWLYRPVTPARKKRVFRKKLLPDEIVTKIKLWPSRKGILHGVRSIKIRGGYMEILTHCNQSIKAKQSKTGRGARWLRNKWYLTPCPQCKIPGWKLEKYGETLFK